jgi:hypothetical protein
MAYIVWSASQNWYHWVNESLEMVPQDCAQLWNHQSMCVYLSLPPSVIHPLFDQKARSKAHLNCAWLNDFTPCTPPRWLQSHLMLAGALKFSKSQQKSATEQRLDSQIDHAWPRHWTWISYPSFALIPVSIHLRFFISPRALQT